MIYPRAPACNERSAYNASSCVESIRTGTLEPRGPVPVPCLRVEPNPARGPVRLEAGGPASSARVFDASGRLVRVLRAAGGLSWDRRDERGRTVPAGVYLLEVATERGTSRARLVLLD